jgi:long-chain acyl-CoA synthetase
MSKELTGYPHLDKPWEKGYSYFKKHPYIPDLSVYNAIKLLNTFYKNKCAVDCLDLQVSYGEMMNDAVTISLALKELGVKKGEVVSVCMPNYYQAVATYLACNRIGAVVTFINSSATEKEICDYVNLYESKVFINYDNTQEQNERIKKNTGLRYIVTLDKNNVNNDNIHKNYRLTRNDELLDYNTLGTIASFQKKQHEKVEGKDDALILYTSGTTGKPKSVVLTNKNIIASGLYQKNTCLTDTLRGDRTLVCVPFTYPYGFCTSTLLTFMSCKTAVLGPDLSKDTISYYMSKNPNIIFGSPALLEVIMKNIDKNQSLASVTAFVSGGDYMSPEAAKRGNDFFEAHGAHDVEISNGSGNAETVSCGTAQTGIKIKPETAGKILIGSNGMIVDPETMKPKKLNEIGMLCMSGGHVFKEYYKDPQRTKEAKFMYNGNEFFKTGTMGSIDEEGYFHITGRLSRFYIISTLNKVYLDHVQSIISSFDCVKDCVVVKVPDDDMLFVNKVYVELNDEYKDWKSEDIIDHIYSLCKRTPCEKSNNEEQLMWYEIPKYIEIVPFLPRKQGTEKLDYNLLEQDALEKKDNGLNLTLKKIK